MVDSSISAYFPLSKMLECWIKAYGKILQRDFYFSAAPGRVNLIGEHTDYHGGFVTPAAIDLKTFVLAAPRADKVLRCYSVNLDQSFDCDLGDMNADALPAWGRYVAGTAYALQEAGLQTRGMDAVVWGTIPFGGGLSSSAAIEVAFIRMFDLLADLGLSRARMAKLGQRAENAFVGVPCGIMDQYASAACEEGSALLLDCRSLETRAVSIPENWRIVVLDTGVHHQLASSEYALRQDQCAEGLAAIVKRHPAVELLRDVDWDMLREAKDDIPPLNYRRLLHVLGENERCLAFAEAMAKGDGKQAGELMAGSHASLKNYYEVSCEELDAAVALAQDLPGLIGARMTGGGFGGSTVNLVEQSEADTFREALEDLYRKEFDGKGHALLLAPSAGVKGGRIGLIR